MNTNNFIQECINNKYAVMNCDERKRPALDAWSKRPSSDFYESVEMNGYYVMRMGRQENEDYIIGLDFDIMEKKKSGKYGKNVITERLLEEWKELNGESHGLYISSTQNNMGNLVNIKNCKELIDIIADIGKSKFENKHSKQSLEILCSSLCILPPTKTVCKVASKAITARTFIDEENPILTLEPNSPQYKFILNYCLEYKNKHCKSTKMRDLRSKSKKELYSSVHNNQYKVNSLDHALELLCLLKDERYCYDSWWKIGVACMNSFEREFAEELFVKWSELDPSGNFDGEIPFDNWSDNDFDGLNWNLIMKWIEYDSPSKFIPCIQEYQRKQVAEKYEEYKKTFEATYHYCKDPQVFFYKSLKGKYIQKTMNDVRELEKHNDEYFKEWCCDEDRKIYEISDSIPVRHVRNPKIFNTFRGYDWWDWDADWYESSKKKATEKLYGETMRWWNKYMYNICGKNMEMVRYLKCVIGNVLFNPCNPTKIMIIFQGIEGTGKSFLINIIKRLLGGLNVAESAKPLDEIFGHFNEPLLTAQVVSIDENEPRIMNAILSQLKNKITNENFNVNCKNEKNFVRTNTLQWFAFMNKYCSFDLTSTNRRFILQKTSMDLAIKNEENSKWWSWGYGTLLKTVECLQFITADIKNVFEEMNGYDLDFALARPQTKYQISVVKQNIPPIFTFLQHFISKPTKSIERYDAIQENKKPFSRWFSNNYIIDKECFIPLSNKVMRILKQQEKLDHEANGFWMIKMKNFRKELNKYISEVLDKKSTDYSSDNILTELTNFFECERRYFDKINVNGEYQYVFNPIQTREQLKKYKYYVIENDDCENTNEKGIDFDIYALDDDEEEEVQNTIIQPNTENDNVPIPTDDTDIESESSEEESSEEVEESEPESDSDSDSDISDCFEETELEKRARLQRAFEEEIETRRNSPINYIN